MNGLIPFWLKLNASFSIFNLPPSGSVWGTVTGSRTLSLPGDATGINFVLNDLTETDGGAKLTLNGITLIDLSGFPYVYNSTWEVAAYGLHNVTPTTKNLSGILHVGDNIFQGQTTTYPGSGNQQQVSLNFAVGLFTTGDKPFVDTHGDIFDCHP